MSCEEFRQNHCYLNPHFDSISQRVHQFSTSCAIPQLPWIFYRTIMALFLLAYWIQKGVGNPTWMVFLTQWTLVSSGIYFAGTAILAIWYKLSKNRNQLPSIITVTAYVTWISHSIQLASPLLISIGFWALLFRPTGPVSALSIINNCIEHGLVAILIILDVLVFLRVDIVLLHMIIPMIGGALYTVNNMAVTLYGNYTNPSNGSPLIYPVTDWKNSPTTTLLLSYGFIFVATPLIFLFHFGLSILKRKYVTDCNQTDFEKFANEEEPLRKDNETLVV